jgi:hypothetical protein
MKRLLFAIFILSVLVSPSGMASAGTLTTPETSQTADYFGPPLCRPGMAEDGNCLFTGPAQAVARLREEGFPYPQRDLPAAPPPDDLGRMPVLVAKINLPDHEPTPIYGSFEAAVAGQNPVRQIAPGALRYVSYITRQDYNGKPFLQLPSGEWLRAAPAAYTDYQGLIFYDNPRNDFGWIVDATPGYRSPSFDAELSGADYLREDVIQVFGWVEAEGVTWYRIGPAEWVNSQKARVVQVNLSPPEEVTSDRWIELNLLQQTLTVYEDGQLKFATLMASGLDPFFTQPGVFTIYEKKPLETMQGAFEADRSDFYYLEDVPWTMYFDEARALHTAYWRTFFGYPQSHGCVNLSPGDAKWLFEWANEGDFVWVHDPSGQTPIDPEYYGPGGA